ncbi:M20/M25/M40 family metallo-hydrolase [Vampirovibrio chlorellavorus]|uniref:M20/M25/M40 family metallo-hydrolase n=1 Tax=Vampirovibrio chlorellavorus TaxID=758823 RepID=UPI0026ED91DE|nr:M20/M25/M40 family metallo-hydrolase [Vampirovibrio chlorellavorus]
MGVVERFQSIVPIDNPSGRESAIRQAIEAALREMGISDCSVDAAGNLFVRVPGNSGKKTIMLSAHMDSVPPCEGIVPVRDERAGRPIIRSEGRTILGADDKSGIAVALEVVSQLAQQGFRENHPLELFFSTGEEVGLTGAKGFDMKQVRASYCYVLDGEGRVGLIFNAGPSQENIQIDCTGRAAHAGIAPEAGISAIQMGAALCAQLPSGRLAEDLTCNLGVIQGGSAMNIVAPALSVKGEMRSHNEDKLSQLLGTYQTVCRQVEERFAGGSVALKNVRRYDRFYVDPEQVVIQRAVQHCDALNLSPQLAPMNIGSDAHILNRNGLPTVVLGMGFHYSHSLGEFIFCEELEQVCQLVQRLVA